MVYYRKLIFVLQKGLFVGRILPCFGFFCFGIYLQSLKKDIAKLLKAFAEVTGIYAEPTFAQVHRWMWAKTMNPLGRSHLWDAKAGIGACGDWCLGHRVEDAFISGLELALAVHKG